MEPEELLDLIRRQPEQQKFDCKATLNLGAESQKAELVKDIIAIANAPGDEVGHLFYGVDLALPSPIVGLSQGYDDAALQQIVAGKLERPIHFLYYEQIVGDKTVGVVVIPASIQRPHIVRTSFGALRPGMIPIRRGSSTTWANYEDLREMFHAPQSDTRDEISELLRAASDPTTKTSTVAVRIWDLASRLKYEQIAGWVEREIVGFSEDNTPDGQIPEYRSCKAYVTSDQLNPYSLQMGGLETIVAIHPDVFTEVRVVLGHSLTQLEQMIDMSRDQARSVLYRRGDFITVGGGAREGWGYFTVDSVQWVLTRIRDMINGHLMRMQAGAPTT